MSSYWHLDLPINVGFFLIKIIRGTIHAWRNTSSEYCRFFTVVIPSEKVKVEETGEYLEVTKIPGLSD